MKRFISKLHMARHVHHSALLIRMNTIGGAFVGQLYLLLLGIFKNSLPKYCFYLNALPQCVQLFFLFTLLSRAFVIFSISLDPSVLCIHIRGCMDISYLI